MNGGANVYAYEEAIRCLKTKMDRNGTIVGKKYKRI